MQIYDQYRSNRFDYIWENCTEHFNLSEVTDAIIALKPNKGHGPMGISVNFIQFNVQKLSPLICDYLTKIIQFGVIPDDWKESYLVPIPKKSNNTLASNYRGIALQSVLPKLFDRLLTRKLQSHLDQIIPPTQHGFCPNPSTITNLLHLTDFIHTEFSKGNQIDVIYFDFTKAFDTIDHCLLGRKLVERSRPFFLYLVIMFFCHK